MKHDWTLIANATHARLLQQEPGQRMVILKSFEHPQSRSKGLGKEHLSFARELAQYLEQEARQGRCESIALFASSPFLGELKAELGDATLRMLSTTADVDLTAVGPAELERRIAHELAHP